MSIDFPTPAAPLRIGTRGSPLALAQAHETRDRLAAAFGLQSEAFEIVVITTTGDAVQDRPLKEIGGKGLFTKEIEEDLLTGAIDIAVHSMKDMPVEQPSGLVLDCYLPREDPRDAFVAVGLTGIKELPHGATVGSSSLRRRAQLLNRRPDLNVVEFRGNVQTRLRKLKEGVAQATFLAMAGLKRLNAIDVPATPLGVEEMLPAVAQGAIGVERHKDDERAHHMLSAIHDHDTGLQLAAERAYLAALDGSCQTPIAGWARLHEGRLTLSGEILSTDGKESHCGAITGRAIDGAEIGETLARQLLEKAGPNFF